MNVVFEALRRRSPWLVFSLGIAIGGCKNEGSSSVDPDRPRALVGVGGGAVEDASQDGAGDAGVAPPDEGRDRQESDAAAPAPEPTGEPTPEPVAPPVDPCAGLGCDDGNPCTEDGCDPKAGTCLYVADDDACGVSVVVLVRDPDGLPLAGAQVRADTVEATTDLGGGALLQGLDAAPVRVVASLASFTRASTPVTPGPEAPQVTLTLHPLGPPVTFLAGAGVAIVRSGVGVSIPPGSVVDAEGKAVNGEVELTVVPFDPTTAPLESAPGPFDGDDEGTEVGLDSIFMAEISLTAGGLPANLAPGATAEVTFPIPETLAGGLEVGDVVPAWWYDVEAGLWRHEGEGVVALDGAGALVWTFEPSHFTWWNCDAPWTDKTCFRVTVRDASTGSVIEGASVFGKGVGYGYSTSATTGSDGSACLTGKRAEAFSVTATHIAFPFPPAPLLVQGTEEAATCAGQGGDCLEVEIAFPACDPALCTEEICGACCGGCPEGEVCVWGGCFSPNACGPKDWPGCPGCACESCVCGIDPYCCEVSWDSLCADECTGECDGGPCTDSASAAPPGWWNVACAPGSTTKDGVCYAPGCLEAWNAETCATGCEARSIAGCDGCPCQAEVCALDSFCCEIAWDYICVDECAAAVPELCPVIATDLPSIECESDGDCLAGDACSAGFCTVADCDPWDASACRSGCEAATAATCQGCPCQGCVCESMPYCCTVSWDETCASACAACAPESCPAEAALLPATPCNETFPCPEGLACAAGFCAPSKCLEPGAEGCHDGCSPRSAPTCDGCGCQGVVCEAHPWCCLEAWSPFCVSQCTLQVPGSCDAP